MTVGGGFASSGMSVLVQRRESDMHRSLPLLCLLKTRWKGSRPVAPCPCNVQTGASLLCLQVGLVGESLAVFSPAGQHNVTWAAGLGASVGSPFTWFKVGSHPTPPRRVSPFTNSDKVHGREDRNVCLSACYARGWWALLVQLALREPSLMLAARSRGIGRHQIASSADKLRPASSSSPSLTRPPVLLVPDLLRGPRRDCAAGSGPGVNGEGPGVG